jgi:Domain of unknown function (DUF5666)
MRYMGGRLSVLVMVALGSLAFAAGGTPTRAAPADALAEGTIESLGADLFTLAAEAGKPVHVTTTAETRIIRRQPADLADIRPRDFIGVAAKKEADGSLTAVSINIFPAEFKGRVREGQWPMESGNIMTNAVVSQYVGRVAGRTVYLTYKEGTAVIRVPAGAEIHRLTVITFGDLTVGMHASVRGTRTPDGGVTASFISVDATR